MEMILMSRMERKRLEAFIASRVDWGTLQCIFDGETGLPLVALVPLLMQDSIVV